MPVDGFERGLEGTPAHLSVGLPVRRRTRPAPDRWCEPGVHPPIAGHAICRCQLVDVADKSRGATVGGSSTTGPTCLRSWSQRVTRSSEVRQGQNPLAFHGPKVPATGCRLGAALDSRAPKEIPTLAGRWNGSGGMHPLRPRLPSTPGGGPGAPEQFTNLAAPCGGSGDRGRGDRTHEVAAASPRTRRPPAHGLMRHCGDCCLAQDGRTGGREPDTG